MFYLILLFAIMLVVKAVITALVYTFGPAISLVIIPLAYIAAKRIEA